MKRKARPTMFQVEGAVSGERECTGSSGEIEVQCLGCRVRGKRACTFPSRKRAYLIP